MYNLEEWKLVETDAVAYEIPRDIFLIEGEKSKQWCNGIFTNNIRSMQPTQFKFNAYCNDRGHVQGFALLLCLEASSFLCILEHPSLDDFQKRFSMFMILDDIESTPKGSKIITLQGSKSSKYLEAIAEDLNLSIPKNDQYGHNSEQNIFCISHDRTGFEGFDIIATTEETYTKVITVIVKHQIPFGTPQTFEGLRILSNKADLSQDLSERNFVHELRINDACCAFDKGCYVGQEIINRMDIKGILNKRLTRILIEEDIDLPCDVFLENSSKKPIGTVTSKAHTPRGIMGLAILRKTAWENKQKVILKSTKTTVLGNVYSPI